MVCDTRSQIGPQTQTLEVAARAGVIQSTRPIVEAWANAGGGRGARPALAWGVGRGKKQPRAA